jgi:putative ABC transport system permease protein
MISRLRVFYQLVVRPLYREPARTLLTILAVALGVAVVLAIELAGEAAAGSFRSSIESLTGGSNLEVTAVAGVPDAVVGTLVRLPYPIKVQPRLDDFAIIPSTGQTIPLIGLDLVAEHPDGFTPSDEANPPTQELAQTLSGNNVWVSSHLGAKRGDTLQLQINDRVQPYTVQGVLKDSVNSGGLVLMDISTAERALHRQGRVDRVLLTVPSTPSIEQWESRLRSALPAGVILRRQGSQTDENRKMLSAFRWNLRILSYVALVVGAFLIFNTISVSVVRRRPEIGIVRALGANRSSILLAFLGEAACFGLVGSIAGILLGRLMAIGAVRLLGATVDNLYVSSTPAPIVLTPAIVLLGLAVGIGVSLASAASPAREAALV